MLIDILHDRRHEIGDPRDDDRLQIEMLDLLIHHVEDHDRSRPRVSKLVGQLVFRVGRVAGHDDPPGPQNAEVGDNCLWRIRETEGHAIAFANSQRCEAAGKSLNEGVAFLVRQGLPKEIESRPA